MGKFVYLHDTYCQGRVVVVLPYAEFDGVRKYLLRTEIVPCWSMTENSLCVLTGAWTGHPNYAVDAAAELKQETGYKIAPEELVPLGVIRGIKAADTYYIGFTVDLTNREVDEMEPTSNIEALGSTAWVTTEELLTLCTDSQGLAFYAKLTALIA